MTLRRRLTLLSAAAVALAVVIASVIVYALVRDQLRDQVDDTLEDLVLILILVSAGGIALAAALGLLVARTSLAPAAAVSAAAEDVARTNDLTRRIEVRGSDELGRLAASFNAMMAALERSVGAQRQLVADASHELRTPLATLRTNIETLGRKQDLEEGERERIVTDLGAEIEDLSGLVGDVVELAREPSDSPAVSEEVRLDEIAAGAVAIRDHGKGFDEGDLPRVFDRFHRSADARGLPGSGLGLAIVRRVAEEHGGAAR